VDWQALERSPVSWLGERVEALGRPEGATAQLDLARQLLCVLGWFASINLAACAELLRGWLLTPAKESDCRRAMGSAGARMLFSMRAARRPDADGLAPRHLWEILAWPLAEQGRDGTASVLGAVRCWLADPELAAYLAEGSADGKGRLLRWAELFAPDQLATLEAALPAEDRLDSVAAEVREAFAAILDRLRLRLALGKPQPLPLLAEGERYGVVIVESMAAGDRLRGRAAGVTRQLFGALQALGLRPIFFRAGERRPAWTGNQAPPSAVVAPLAVALPPLMGAPLSIPELGLERVGLVVVVAAHAMADLDDWIETPWRRRLVLCQVDGATWREPAIFTMPDVPSQVDVLQRYLGKCLEGGVAR
jgi:hypothetical protein